MKIDILTLFPEIALSPLSDSIIQRARDAGLVEIHGHNLRDWSEDKHKRVDDTPCGGGAGMVLQPGPLACGDHGTEKGEHPGDPDDSAGRAVETGACARAFHRKRIF